LRNEHLKIHMNRHEGLKPHVCNFKDCNIAFSDPSALRVHMRIHDGSKPYKCEFDGCTLAFSQSSNLKKHLQTHTGEKTHFCTYEGCGKSLSGLQSLQNHVRTHTKERPFVCDYKGCEKSFAVLSTLKTHKLTHSECKTHVCGFEGCGKRFTLAMHLKSHTRVHTNEKPFVCNFEGCGARFTNSSTLIIHYRNHSGEKPYLCSFESCCAAFKQLPHLKDHTERWHTKRGIQKHKREEERIAKFLAEKNFVFVREERIKFCAAGDTWASADFVLSHPNACIILEVDEHQHLGYGVGCELSRMTKCVEALRTAGNETPIMFVRYNPHGFASNGRASRVPRDERQEKLAELLCQILASKEVPYVAICYAFYDSGLDGRPAILSDPEYPECARAWFWKSIA